MLSLGVVAIARQDWKYSSGYADWLYGGQNLTSLLYHGLLVSLRHRSRQFLSSASYTFSKTIDQGTGYFNQFDQASQRGPSQLDQTHRFVATGVWTPQFRALKNFECSGVLNLASGRPYTAVFDQSEVNFSVVPGEGFNSFRGPTVKT